MDFQIPPSKWIWIPHPEALKPDAAHLVLFRKSFSLSAVEPCRVRVSADTRYKLWCNGVLVALGPAKGDKSVWYYDEIDLTPALRPGENVLCAQVLRYPPLHNRGNHSLFRTETPGLYVEELYDGLPEPLSQSMADLAADADPVSHGRLGLSADASWKCKPVPGFSVVQESPFFAPLMFMEEVTADPALHGWLAPAYDDSSWNAAVPYPSYFMRSSVVPGNLLPRPIPPMAREKKQLESVVQLRSSAAPLPAWEALLRGTGKVTVPAHAEEVVDLSAGCEETGFLSLRLEGGAGARVELLCAEAYGMAPEGDDPFAPVVKGNRSDCLHGDLHGYTDRYTVSGAGTPDSPETYEPFWFRTFRFLRLTVRTGDVPLTLAGLDYQETGYPLEVRTRVETSDPTLGPIWAISERTLRRCMQETYTDCPFYEQLQYVMDSRSQILYTYMVSADDRLARNCMEDFRRSQRYDGMLNCSYPNFEPNIIPGFSIYYILMLHDHMMFFGDRSFLTHHLPCVDGILRFFDTHRDPRGLVDRVGGPNGAQRYWSFIDWTTQWDATSGVPTANLRGPVTMESLLYVYGLQAAADLADFTGRGDTAAEYRRRAAAVQEAIRACCVDPAGFVTDGPGVPEVSQHCQVFALLTETLPLEQCRANLLQTLRAPDRYAQCSVAMAYYLFRALEKAGLYEETGPLWNVWRDMVKNDLTTCVEDSVRGRSDCHAWGALALYELPAVVLGVRPAAPGFARVEVRPVPGPFTWARGEVITPKGPVQVRWEKSPDGALTLETTLPPALREN